jgi:hypothetical protein
MYDQEHINHINPYKLFYYFTPSLSI